MSPFDVAALQAVFQENAERACLVTPAGETLTYRAVENAASGVASSLAAAGLKPGDVVAVMADNSLDHAIALLGAWGAGLTTALLNAELGLEQVRAIIENADAKAVLHDARNRAAAEATGVRCLAFATMRGQAPMQGARIFHNVDPDAPLLIVYTAGSTGRPKGVQLSAAALLRNERLFCNAMGIGENNRFFNILPMSYLGGVHNLLLLPMTVGASVVLDQPMGASNLFYFWRRVRDLEIDTLWLTGAMLSLLLEMRPRGDESWIGRQVRLGLVGMAPLQAETRLRFEARFGFQLHQNYALSETLFLTSQRPGEPVAPAGCGRLLPDVEIAIRDGEGRAAKGEGELVVRTPSMMVGYRDAPESDSAALRDGAFHTGDLGRFDAKGELLITGRIKDLIIRGGLNISPALVEAALVRCPLVAEAAVVGAPDQTYGEEVAAFLRLSPEGLELGEEGAVAEIRAHAHGVLAPFQRPKRIVVLDALPLNHARKIDKPALRRWLADAGSDASNDG